MACSVLSIRTVSASAFAFSASAFAFLTVGPNVRRAVRAARRPPPNIQFKSTLVSMITFYDCLIPIETSHFCTSKLGQAFAASSL